MTADRRRKGTSPIVGVEELKRRIAGHPPSSPESPNSGMSKAERAEFNDCNRPFARKVNVVAALPESPTLETLLDDFKDAAEDANCECWAGPCKHQDALRSSREAVVGFHKKAVDGARTEGFAKARRGYAR